MSKILGRQHQCKLFPYAKQWLLVSVKQNSTEQIHISLCISKCIFQLNRNSIFFPDSIKLKLSKSTKQQSWIASSIGWV